AGLASCVAAAMALLLARSSGDMSLHSKFPLRLDASYRAPWRLLLVSFGTGCILLCLEVVWFRFLRLYVASSPTTFAIMLAVVLAGIGFGGIVAGVIHRGSGRLNDLLPVLLLLAAIAALLSYLLFPERLAQTRTGVFDLSWRVVALLSLALMFPVAFLSGILPYHPAESHFSHASKPYEIDEHGNVLAHVVKRIEGTSDTLQLLRRDLFGEPYYYRLLTNDFSMSATNPRNQRYMRLFAYLP